MGVSVAYRAAGFTTSFAPITSATSHCGISGLMSSISTSAVYGMFASASSTFMCLGIRHAVARDDHDAIRLLEQLGRAFDRLLLPRFLLPHRRRLLHGAERPEQHVGERAIHRPAHDDRQDQTARAGERARRDEQLVVEHKPYRDRRKAGVGVQD